MQDRRPRPPTTGDVRRFYNQMLDARDRADPWHAYTHQQIERFVRDVVSRFPLAETAIVLNAGSGGNALGLPTLSQVEVDIAEKRLSQSSSGIAAHVEHLPFRDCAFDLVICVGCVINYCDAARG